MLKRSFFTFATVLLAAMISNGQVPQLINYQAMLTDAQGNPINGVRSIQFSIYDSETGGNVLWSETQNVIVTDGLCNVLLGSVTLIPYSVFDGGDRYFSLKVGNDPPMTPRTRLVSVGYAFHSNDADSLDGYSSSDFVRSVDGVTSDDGNIELVEGTNITIEPNEDNNTITISASGSPGGGDLTLPYTGTTESSSTAFSITNTGAGRAGYFKVNNSSNDNHVLFCETNGTGPAGLFRILNSGNSSNAVHGYTTGSGSALYGHARGSGAALNAGTKGTGKAGNFTIDNAENNSSVVYSETNGLGRAGHFSIANTENSQAAVSASTQGSGAALSGYTTGTGQAGYFRINNSNSNSTAIYSENNGLGRAGHFRIVNADNSLAAVSASTQGSGPALSGYTIGSGSAVYGRTDGSGEAGHFEITSSGNGETAVFAKTGGTGDAVYGEHANSGNFGSLGGSDQGVLGSSADGAGVKGLSTTSTGYGVWGQSAGSGTGVVGRSSYGVGVEGRSDGKAVSAEGDLYVSGAYRGDISSSSGNDGAPFPRPAYDSGWISIEPAERKELTHNIGGTVDNYVVDVQFKETDSGSMVIGINNYGIGGDDGGLIFTGAHWDDLTTSKISIYRLAHDYGADFIRIRIWVYR